MVLTSFPKSVSLRQLSKVANKCCHYFVVIFHRMVASQCNSLFINILSFNATKLFPELLNSKVPLRQSHFSLSKWSTQRIFETCFHFGEEKCRVNFFYQNNIEKDLWHSHFVGWVGKLQYWPNWPFPTDATAPHISDPLYKLNSCFIFIFISYLISYNTLSYLNNV